MFSDKSGAHWLFSVAMWYYLFKIFLNQEKKFEFFLHADENNFKALTQTVEPCPLKKNLVYIKIT